MIDILRGLCLPEQKVFRGAFITFVLPLVLIAILYTGPILFQGSAASPLDLITYNLRYIAWAQHPFSLWNDLWSGGFPGVASPHDDRFYPFGFPVYFLFPAIETMNLVLVAHLYIAYLTMRRLAGTVSNDNRLLLLAGLSYAFSGALVSRLDIGHVDQLYALAWLPLVYDSFFRILWGKTSPAKGALIFALSFTLLFLTGSVYFAVFAAIFLGIALVCAIVQGKVTRTVLASLVPGVFLAGLLVSVKLLPDLIISSSLVRIDPIDPLSGGGSLEAAVASWISGSSINPVFGYWESAVLVGAVPLLLAVLAFLWGKKEIAVPGFLSLLFTLVWSAAGNSLLSPLHLMPGLMELRCPGRIFSAFLPILLLLAVYGAVLLAGRLKRAEGLALDRGARLRLLCGGIILIVAKALEIPWQGPMSPLELVSVLLVAGFLVLLVSGKADHRNILAYLAVSVVLEALLIGLAMPGSHLPALPTAVLTAIVILAGFYALTQWHPDSRQATCLCFVLVAGLIVSMAGSTAFISVHDPVVHTSPMKAVIEEVQKRGSDARQIWILENGRKSLHADLAYWAARYGIHHADAYYPYYLDYPPDNLYIIGGTGYALADYMIDTASLEPGRSPVSNASFSVEGIGVVHLTPVLPNAFVIRHDRIVKAKTVLFTPDEVVLTGPFRKGDTAILKYAFAPGWTVNGIAATRVNNLTGAPLLVDADAVIFRFEPWYFYAGAVLSLAGIAGCVLLFLYRRRYDDMCRASSKKPTYGKGKKP